MATPQEKSQFVQLNINEETAPSFPNTQFEEMNKYNDFLLSKSLSKFSKKNSAQKKSISSCPFLNKNTFRDIETPIYPHYEIKNLIYYPYDFFFDNINYKTNDLIAKSKQIRNCPHFIRNTLFINEDNVKRVRAMNFSQSFIIGEQLKDTTEKLYKEGNYFEALQQYNLIYSLYRWMEFKDKKKEETLMKDVTKIVDMPILDSDVILKRCAVNDPEKRRKVDLKNINNAIKEQDDDDSDRNISDRSISRGNEEEEDEDEDNEESDEEEEEEKKEKEKETKEPKKEPKKEINNETKKEINNEIKKEINNEIKKEINNEIKKEINKETKKEINKEIKKEINKEIKNAKLSPKKESKEKEKEDNNPPKKQQSKIEEEEEMEEINKYDLINFKKTMQLLLKRMGYCYIHLCSYSEAIECFNEAFKYVDDDCPDFYFRRAQAKIYNKNSNLNDLKSALGDLNKALSRKITFHSEILLREHKLVQELIAKKEEQMSLVPIKLLNNFRYAMNKIKEKNLNIGDYIIKNNELDVTHYKILKEVKEIYFYSIKQVVKKKNQKLFNDRVNELDKFLDKFYIYEEYFNFDVEKINIDIYRRLNTQQRVDVELLKHNKTLRDLVDELKYRKCEEFFDNLDLNEKIYLQAHKNVMEIQKIENDINNTNNNLIDENHNFLVRALMVVINKLLSNNVKEKINQMFRNNFYFISISLLILTVTIISSQLNKKDEIVQ